MAARKHADPAAVGGQQVDQRLHVAPERRVLTDHAQHRHLEPGEGGSPRPRVAAQVAEEGGGPEERRLGGGPPAPAPAGGGGHRGPAPVPLGLGPAVVRGAPAPTAVPAGTKLSTSTTARTRSGRSMAWRSATIPP